MFSTLMSRWQTIKTIGNSKKTSTTYHWHNSWFLFHCKIVGVGTMCVGTIWNYVLHYTIAVIGKSPGILLRVSYDSYFPYNFNNDVIFIIVRTIMCQLSNIQRGLFTLIRRNHKEYLSFATSSSANSCGSGFHLTARLLFSIIDCLSLRCCYY